MHSSATPEDVATSWVTDPPGRMARFILSDGMTLEVHVPDAIAIDVGGSQARTAGFILRYGREIVDVGLLNRLVRDRGKAGRCRSG